MSKLSLASEQQIRMDEIHGLRDKYKADVAVLIVDDPQGCGLATRVYADADKAFAVVHHECAVQAKATWEPRFCRGSCRSAALPEVPQRPRIGHLCPRST